jgi:hypothetical protein
LFSDAHVEESSDARFRSQISVSQDIVLPSIGAGIGGIATATFSPGNGASAVGNASPSPMPAENPTNAALRVVRFTSPQQGSNASNGQPSTRKPSSTESENISGHSLTAKQIAMGSAPAEEPATTRSLE